MEPARYTLGCAASPECLGRMALAGASARSPAAAKLQGGITAIGAASAGGVRMIRAALRTRLRTATAASEGGENPISVKTGSVTALNTAQPTTGAAASASTRGRTWRDTAKPSTVQNAVASNAPRTALTGDAIETTENGM